MSRDIPPYGLRMPQELRAKIEHEATITGRSLNAEIVARLWASLDSAPRQPTLPAVIQDSASGSYLAMSDQERSMLALFRRWPVEKQLSFLVLFK